MLSISNSMVAVYLTVGCKQTGVNSDHSGRIPQAQSVDR